MKVSGWGLPAKNAHTSNARYTQEWVRETHFKRPKTAGRRVGPEGLTRSGGPEISPA